MAVTLTSVASGTGSTGQTHDYSFTPSANKTYLIAYQWETAGVDQTNTLGISVTAGSSNFASGPTLVGEDRPSTADPYEAGVAIYKVQAAASPSGSTTVRATSSVSIMNIRFTVLEVAGGGSFADLVSEAYPFTATSGTLNGSVAETLAAAPAVGDAVAVFVTYNCDGNVPVTPTSGFTELYDLSVGNPWVFCQWRNDTTSTTVTAPQGGEYNLFAAVAVVIPQAGGTTPTGTGTPTDVRDTGSGLAAAGAPKQVINLKLDTTQGGGDGKTDTEVWLTWDAVTGASSYEVERDSTVIATGVATTTYHDTGRSASTAYAYRVRAKL